MRVVIEIDEDFYKQTIEHNRLCWEYMGMNEMVKSIKNGIPLDNLRAEIQTKYDEIPWRYNDYDDGWSEALEWVLEIIDKYRNEVNHD